MKENFRLAQYVGIIFTHKSSIGMNRGPAPLNPASMSMASTTVIALINAGSMNGKSRNPIPAPASANPELGGNIARIIMAHQTVRNSPGT